MRFLNFLKRRKYLSIAVVVVVVIILVATSRGGGDDGADYVEATTETLVRKIDVTGRVKPAESISLAFESSGRVSSVSSAVGDRVFVGEVLARVSSGSVSADLAQAKARLKSEEAKLLELQIGSRPEEVAVQEVKVANAEVSVSESKQALLDEIFISLTKADDSIRNKADQLFSNSSSDNPKLNVSTTQSQLQIDVESGRVKIGKTLNDWTTEVTSLSLSSDLDLSGKKFKGYLDSIKLFLDKMSIIVNSLEPSPSLTQTQIDSYRSDVFTARSNTDTASSNLSTDREKLNTSISALNLAKEELTLMQAGSRAQDILGQEAKVEEAEANVLKFEAELSKTIIFSPISGVVTDILVDPGEIISSGALAISLISDKNLQIEANIPESDIIFLNVGDEAKVELDAYGNDVIFVAKILKIDPAETIIDGVPVYKITLEFVEEDERVRSGMTADISIITDQKENALAVPKRAVLNDNGRIYVRVWSEGVIEEREVSLGFEGNDGKVEITEGLSKGELVVTFIKN